MRSSRFYSASIVLLTTLIVLAAANFSHLRGQLAFVDYYYLDGSVFRLFNREYGGYSRDSVTWKSKTESEAYLWNEHESQDAKHKVLHKLGGENSVTGYFKSLDAGYRIFEVDLILVDDTVVCGREDVGIPADAFDCNLHWLMERVTHDDSIFILDVKTDFESAYEVISNELNGFDKSKNFVPQIYQLYQFSLLDFGDCGFGYPLFTTYRFHLGSIEGVLLAREFGIETVVIPNHVFLQNREVLPNDMGYFVHGLSGADLENAFADPLILGVYATLPALERRK